MTLDELVLKHCHDVAEHTPSEYTIYEFTIDQLRALITEAVGIVAGEPEFKVTKYMRDDGSMYLSHVNNNRHAQVEIVALHAIDMGRLK